MDAGTPTADGGPTMTMTSAPADAEAQQPAPAPPPGEVMLAQLRVWLAEDPARVVAMLPALVTDGIVAAAARVPRRVCATCLLGQARWAATHRAELQQALATAAQVCGLPPEDPRARQLDISPFLPPHLRPGTAEGPPQVSDAVTTVAGTEVCQVHHPDMPAEAGRSPLAVAFTGNVHIAAQQALAGAPGMPGLTPPRSNA